MMVSDDRIFVYDLAFVIIVASTALYSIMLYMLNSE